MFYADLWGGRSAKYETLADTDVSTTHWKEIHPAAAFFEFVPVKRAVRAEYQAGWSVKDIFVLGSNGAQTSRDSLVVAFNKPELTKRIEEFADPEQGVEEARSRFFGGKSVADYPSGDTREWKLADARVDVAEESQVVLRDQRLSLPAFRPPRAALPGCNGGLATPRCDGTSSALESRHLRRPGRAVATGEWDLVFCANDVCDHNLFYRGSSLNFPLYLYETEGKKKGGWGKNLTLALFESSSGYHTRRPNLNPTFLKALAGQLKLPQQGEYSLPKGITPEDVFDYVYALFHSGAYRERYAQFLKIDFPRLPLTSNLEIFPRAGRA